MDNLAPILLFVYSRPSQTRKTLAALAKNKFANRSELIIYADGPKEDADQDSLDKVAEVRKIIKEIDWCENLSIVESISNKGLANSVIEGMTAVLETHNSVIVMEDDIVTSAGFLAFMNEALSLYGNSEKIASVTGYLEPILNLSKGISFATKGSSWGWATWKRTWDQVDFNTGSLIAKFDSKAKIKRFNLGGYPYYEMLLAQQNGSIDSWAIRFYASCFLQNKLHIVPSKSLVRNIGFDGSGIHCGEDIQFQNQDISNSQIVSLIPIKADKLIGLKLRFYLKKQSIKAKLGRVLNFNKQR